MIRFALFWGIDDTNFVNFTLISKQSRYEASNSVVIHYVCDTRGLENIYIKIMKNT